MSGQFRREFLTRLPLPLAQLYRRSFTDKSARSRHDNAYYLFEALFKLAAAPSIACYLDEVDAGAARVEPIDKLLANLALPSIGHWKGMVQALAAHFGKRTDARQHPLGHLHAQLTRARNDLPGALALYQRIKTGPDAKPSGDSTCSPLSVFDA
ncbi:MAG TPA: hypothetical protein VHV77_09065, partial [Pirellulales bacterium]|nr:hypothetical protein [Pirellulales bacterium]